MGVGRTRVGTLIAIVEAKLEGRPLPSRAKKVKTEASLRTPGKPGSGPKANPSKLKCEVCGEPITQWAVNHGETRFCSRGCAIQGGGMPDPWGTDSEEGDATGTS